MNKNKIYTEMTRYIESMIASGIYPPESKAPSLRDLTQKFGISLGTAKRGIDKLVEKGILEFRHGSGTYVASSQKNIENGIFKRIAVFLVNDNPDISYCALALTGAQEAAAENHCSLLLNFFTYENISEESVKANSEGCEGMMFFGCYDLHLRRLGHSIPGVGLSMHSSYGGLLSLIELDPFKAAEDAALFFSSKGYKHVKIISHDMPPHKARGQIFKEIWEPYGSSELQYYNEQIFSAEVLNDEKSAYFFSSGSDFNGASSIFEQEHGKTMSSMRCVVSVDGKSLFVPGYHPVNTVAIDWREAGKTALEELLRRINSPGTSARRIYINCILHEL